MRRAKGNGCSNDTEAVMPKPRRLVAAAIAGKDELKQAAKRARDARRKPPREKSEAPSDRPDASAPEEDGDEGAAALRRRVAQLTAENASLAAENAALRKQVLALLGKSQPAGKAPSAAQDGDVAADPPF